MRDVYSAGLSGATIALLIGAAAAGRVTYTNDQYHAELATEAAAKIAEGAELQIQQNDIEYSARAQAAVQATADEPRTAVGALISSGVDLFISNTTVNSEGSASTDGQSTEAQEEEAPTVTDSSETDPDASLTETPNDTPIDEAENTDKLIVSHLEAVHGDKFVRFTALLSEPADGTCTYISTSDEQIQHVTTSPVRTSHLCRVYIPNEELPIQDITHFAVEFTDSGTDNIVRSEQHEFLPEQQEL